MPRRNGRRGQPQHGKELKRPRGWHRKRRSPETIRWDREQQRRAA